MIMKTKNTHGVFNHVDDEAESAIFKRALIIVVCALAITLIGIFYAQKAKQDQDKRTEYIEQSHSELK